jgi:hypothetical protein
MTAVHRTSHARGLIPNRGDTTRVISNAQRSSARADNVLMFSPVDAASADPARYVDRPAEVRPAEAEVVERSAKFQALLRPLTDVFEPWVQRARAGVSEVINRLNPPLTAEERGAVELMRSMMAPDKLGGDDRTFNHRDIEAVTAGISDRGIKGVVARSLAKTKLPEGLTQAGVVADPTAAADATPRKISASELQAFQRASEALEGRKEQLRRFGLEVQFPNGVSEAAFDHMLEGKFGLPPGAKLVRVDSATLARPPAIITASVRGGAQNYCACMNRSPKY